MKTLLKTIHGNIIKYGKESQLGLYNVFEEIQIQNNNGYIEIIKNVAINPNFKSELKNCTSFKFANSNNFNSHYKYNYLCGIKNKNGKILTDDKFLKIVYKARYIIAYLSLIPPFILISPLVFKKAKEFKLAYENVGVFD